MLLIPTALESNRRPLASCDGSDCAWLGGEGVPSVATGIDDGVVAVEDGVGEPVLAQVLPDVLHWIELGRVGRQLEQADVVRDGEPAPGLMPAGSVEQHHGMAARRDVAADLGQMQVHRLAIGHRQNERCPRVAGRTDGAEQIGPIVALVARRPWPAAALGPYSGQRALLPDPGFVLPPEFDRLAARVRRDAG